VRLAWYIVSVPRVLPYIIRLLLLSNNEKMTLSESKATTFQSKLSKLELKADLFYK